MGNSHLLLSKFPLSTQKKTKNTIEVRDVGKDMDEAKIPLQQMLTLIPSREKREISPKSSASPAIGRDIIQICVPRIQKGVKKLVSVLTTSTPMTGTREEAVETAKADGTAKAIKTTEVGEESKGKYLNLTQVLCIKYPIIF